VNSSCLFKEETHQGPVFGSKASGRKRDLASRGKKKGSGDPDDVCTTQVEPLRLQGRQNSDLLRKRNGRRG